MDPTDDVSKVSGSVAWVRVVARLEVDVTDRRAFLKHEGPRLPRQISLWINLRLGLLPAPVRGGKGGSVRRNPAGCENRQSQQRQPLEVFVLHGPIVSVVSRQTNTI